MFRRQATRRQDEPLPRPGRQHQDDLLKKQLVALEAVSARHSAHVTIMWQAPSLGVAAQAFLLTIALAPGSSTTSRVTVSVLGVVIAALVSQFMAKHRHASQRDGKVLEELVDRLDLTDIFSAANEVKSTWLSRRSSYVSWRIGLTIFLIVNMAILILSIVHPDVFGGSPGDPRE